MGLKKLWNNTEASAIPLIMYVLGIFVVGLLYTIFFIYVAEPLFYPFIRDSIYKTVITGVCYYVPLVVLVIMTIALIISGRKNTVPGGMM